MNTLLAAYLWKPLRTGFFHRRCRLAADALARGRAVAPEPWLLVVLGGLLVAFLAALIVEPGSVGRGGR